MDDLIAFLTGRLDEDVANHIGRHDPDRVLREVEAKRAILAEHPADQNGFKWINGGATRVPDMRCATCHEVPDDPDYDNCCDDFAYPCPTVLTIAAVYADHPDYRDEWRP